MKAASLLCVFIAARLAILAGSQGSWSFGALLAWLWQDAAFVLVFSLLERVPRSRLVITVLYWLIAIYVASNVPVIRMFSTPLTWPMLRATRGTLADSLGHHVDFANLAAIGVVLATAGLAPLWLRRAARKPGRRFHLLLSAVCLLGFWTRSAVEPAGFQRNCIAALISSGREQVTPAAHVADWRRTSTPSPLASLPGTGRGRNVVLILLESTGARHLSFYGAELDATPNLTRLAQTGIVFERAYAVYPESIKGLFSIVSSRCPGIETATESYREIGKPALAHVLRDAGYRTALFHSGRFMYLGMDDILHQRGYEQLFDAGAIGGERESSFGVEEPATVARILEWLQSVPAEQPFFLTYLPTAGHHPYFTPQAGPFPEETDAQRHRNALHYGDEALGQLLDGMKKLGRYENSLFVFCGDHGEAFGEHAGNFGHTLNIYEENVRVPLVLFAPGLNTAEHRVPHLASVIDVAPTLLDWLGLPAPGSYQGVSLLRFQPDTALFFTDYASRWVGLREGRWKFVYEFESSRAGLFDLEQDPGEKINLAAVERERTRLYERRARDWLAAQKESVLREAAHAPAHRMLSRFSHAGM